MSKTKRWLVTGEATISIHIIVEAKTAKEARELADDRGMPGLCHQCASEEGNTEEWRTSGELDGTPLNLSAEELDS